MPPLNANSNRPARSSRPRRRKPRPYTLPSGPRGDAPQTRASDLRRAEAHKRTPSYRHAVAKTRAEQAPHPSGVFARPVSSPPLARQQGQQAARSRRAQDRLPSNPRLPHVPVVRDADGRRVITPATARRVYTAVQREARKAGGLRRLYEASPRRDRELLRLFGLIRDAKTVEAAKSRPSLLMPAKPGPAHKRLGIGPASIDLTSLGRKVVGQTSFKYGAGTPSEKLVGNALGDVKALGEAPFVAGYELAASAWEAAHGDTGRAVRLGKGVVEGIKESVPGQLVQGDLAGANKAFHEHPLFAALDLGAVSSVAGRTAGAFARGVGSSATEGGVRGGLARVGSTVRPPIAMVDDAGAAAAGHGLVERRYSKDLTRKAAQVQRDSFREPLRDAAGNVVTVEQRGRRVPVLRASTAERDRHARRAADFASSRANSGERLGRDVAAREVAVHGPAAAAAGRAGRRVARAVGVEFDRAVVQHGIRGARGRDLVAMVVEGTITSAKHFEADLRARRAQVKGFLDEHEQALAAGRKNDSPFRSKGEVRAARRTLHTIDAALSDKRVLANKAKIVDAGVAIGRRLTTVGEREAQELGLLHKTRAERSRRVPVASTHMGGRYFTPEELRQVGHVPPSPGQQSLLPDDVLLTEQEARHGGVRKANGEFLSNREVDAFLRGRGRDPESVAYLPHRLDVRGRRAFHTQFRPGSRGTMEKAEVRTGHAYERGVTESSARLIQEQGVRQATQINKARQLDRMVADQGLRRPDGDYFTAKGALETAERLWEDSGHTERWVPVRAFAAKLDAGTQKVIREDLQGPAGMESLGQMLLHDRIVRGADPAGAARAKNVVLVQQAYIDQLQRHLRPAGAIQKFFQMVNRPFRFAVLAQPRWLVGNFVEPFLVRLPVAGGGLVNVFGLGLDVTAAVKGLRRMERSGDPRLRAAAREIRAQQEGGLFIGGRGASVRRSADELPMFNEAYGRMVAKLPVVAQGVDLARTIGRVLMAPGNVYFRVNRAIERVAQDASIGKSLRKDMQEWSGSWLKTVRLQSEALDEALRGLVDTPTQRRFMREQHELLGKYEGFPPWLREIVQGPMPFLPWALNAARFVYWTMPAHHTALESLLLKVNDVVAKDWEEVHKGTPPGGLRLAIPSKKGGWIDLARYTPYGLTGPAVEGDLEGLNQVAPQFQGPAMALFLGLDAFGRPLQMSDRQDADAGDRVKAFFNALVEAGTPYVAQARRIREGGGTAFSDSTLLSPRVKPGTDHMSGLRRTFDPFRPTYLRAPASGASSSGRRAPAPTGVDAEIERALRGIDAGAAAADPLDEEIQRALENLP